MLPRGFLTKIARSVLLAAVCVPALGSLLEGRAFADIRPDYPPAACVSDATHPCISLQTPAGPTGAIVVTGQVQPGGDPSAPVSPHLALSVKDGDTTVYTSESPQIYAQPSIRNEAFPLRTRFEFDVDQSALSGSNRFLTFTVTASTLAGATDSHGLLLPLRWQQTSNPVRVWYRDPSSHFSMSCSWSTGWGPFQSAEPQADGWIVSAFNMSPGEDWGLSLVDENSHSLWSITAHADSAGQLYSDDISYQIHIPADRFPNQSAGSYQIIARSLSSGAALQSDLRRFVDVCPEHH